MKKIIIFLVSICIVSAFGGVRKNHAQIYSITECDCISWLKYPSLKNYPPLSSAAAFAPASADRKGLTTFEKILNVPLGIILGSFTGYIIGSSISSTDQEQQLVNRMKGVLIGAVAGPFVNYEILLALKDKGYRSNRWYLKGGGNLIRPNHDDAVEKPGYSIGLSDYFPLGRFWGLQGDFTYQSRQFSLSSQRILHTTMVSREIHVCDIDFSVAYIDMALLLNVRLLTLRKSNFNLAIGPSLSLEMFDNTKYHLIKVEEDNDDYDFVYIDDEPDPLFGYPAMLYQLEWQRGKWIWQLGFQNSMMDTDEIYPLISKTRMRTLELSIGYKL